MTLFQSVVLGIVQGLTEFIPVSSSGHLVLVPYLFGWDIPSEQAFVFDILVQLGTLLAVIVYFRKDLYQIIQAWINGLWAKEPFADLKSKLGWLLILSTLPAVVFGVILKDLVEAAFNSVTATAAFLLVTAILLVSAERVGKRARDLPQIDWKDALIIGLFQVIAIFPGVSRSGSTITGGMFRNLERQTAASFSFLMSIPVMLGAGVFSLLDLFAIPSFLQFLPNLLVGFISSAVVGFLSIHWLLSYLAKRSLYIFAGYVAVVGLALLLIR